LGELPINKTYITFDLNVPHDQGKNVGDVMNGSNKSSFDFHSFIKRTDGYSSAGKLP
jgi:hypothetical protein